MLQKELWLPGMQEDTLILPERISDFLEILIPVDAKESEWDAMMLVNNSGSEFIDGNLD